MLAPDIALWRRLEGLYFYKAPGSKYYFGLPKEDCCNCYPVDFSLIAFKLQPTVYNLDHGLISPERQQG